MRWGSLRSLLAIVWLALATMPTASAHADSWYWVPSQITNGAPGRSVLTSSPQGLIGQLLTSLGMFWSHSGMFIDNGYYIRHNTADPDSLKTVDSSGRGCGDGSVCIPDRINGATLLAIKPGLITQSVADAYGASGNPEFNFYDQTSSGALKDRNAVVLSRRNVKDIGGTIYYTGAANTMVSYESFYSFYSFTDIWTTQPDTSDPTHIHFSPDISKRNMCAGTISWALFSGGGFAIWPLTYPASLRDAAAPVLYRNVYNYVGKKAPGAATGAFIGGLLTGNIVGAVAGAIVVSSIANATKDRIANQVVNCMAFNDCYNTGGRWKNGTGDGMSISPDNLLPVGYVNPLGQMWGISGYDPSNTWSQWYDSVEPISYTGGYWKKY